MVLSNAKILDSTRFKHNGRRQESNQANTNRNHGNNSHNNKTPSTSPYTKWTGKTMVMKKGMGFSSEDWKKVTKAQKTQVYAFLKEKKTAAASTTVTVNNTEIQPTPTPITTTITPTPHTVMQAKTDIHHLLPNKTSRDSNSLPSQVVIDGRTYTLSPCDCAYSIHPNS